MARHELYKGLKRYSTCTVVDLYRFLLANQETSTFYDIQKKKKSPKDSDQLDLYENIFIFKKKKYVTVPDLILKTLTAKS